MGGTLTNHGVMEAGGRIGWASVPEDIVNSGIMTAVNWIRAQYSLDNSGVVTAGGSVDVEDGTLTNDAGGSITAYDIRAEHGIDNSGSLVAGGTVSSDDGNLTNHLGATIFAGLTIFAEVDMLNHGTMIAGYRVEADRDLTNEGTMVQLVSHEKVEGKDGITNEGTLISGTYVKSEFGSVVNSSTGVLLAGAQVHANAGFQNYNIADIRWFVFADNGALLNDTGAQMTVGEYLNIDGDITNRGTLNVSGYVDSDGSFENESTGTVTVGNYVSVDGDFTNHGTTDVVAFVEADGDFENSGTLEAGFIWAPDGSFENSGFIETVGSLTLSDGTNTVVFGDGQEIIVGSELAVDGTLDLVVDDDASVAAGDTFTIVEFGSLTGRFDSIDGLLREGDGLVFDPVFGSESFDVTARAINSRVGTADYLVGTAGNDILVVDGGGDVLLGRDGADRFTIGDGTFHYINGGNGFDRLFADFDLDLTALRDELLKDMELIDITSTGIGGNTIDFTFSDVVAATDGLNTLYISRDDGDTVNMGGGWTDVTGPTPPTFEGDEYKEYTQTVGSDTATVFVEIV